MTCPFTHSTTQRHAQEVITWNEDGEEPLYAVECCGCGARGPLCGSEEAAVEAWDARVVADHNEVRQEYSFDDGCFNGWEGTRALQEMLRVFRETLKTGWRVARSQVVLRYWIEKEDSHG